MMEHHNIEPVTVRLKLFGDIRLGAISALFIFHSPLILHWALMRWSAPKYRAVITLIVISIMITISLSILTHDFVMAYCRVMAVLFAMQFIRLIMDPRIKFLQTASLRSYMLSIMSFGPVALPGALADQNANPIRKSELLYDVIVLVLKYAVVHAIHLYLWRYPYPTQPPVRNVADFTNWQSTLMLYLIAVQLYMYMSIYYALSFGAYALIWGQRAPSIFAAPLLSASPRDFWSRRWNMLFKQGLHDTIFVPVLYLLRSLSNRGYRIYTADQSTVPTAEPTRLNSKTKAKSAVHITNGTKEQPEQNSSKKVEKPPAWHLMCASLATFVFSGIMHEYFIFVIFHNPPTFENTIFFSLHGVIVVLQSIAEMLMPRKVIELLPRWTKQILTTLIIVYTSPLFFNPFFRADALNRFHLPLLIRIYDDK